MANNCNHKWEKTSDYMKKGVLYVTARCVKCRSADTFTREGWLALPKENKAI